MYERLKVAGALTAGCLTLTLAGGLGTALADPPSGVTPAAGDIVGVGSDTTQYVMDAFAKSYDGQNHGTVSPKVYSWDAVNPQTGQPGDSIVTKSGCAAIARPDGGSAGVSALQASVAAGNHCIDFARTITPKATNGTQNNLAFFAYGRDGVAWSAIPSSNTPSSLTPSQLASIYTCTVTNWHSISASLPSNPIHPYLPQSGSALGKNFLAYIGVTTPGSCVTQSGIEQNEGTVLNGDDLALVPFSIASWIAQNNKAIPDLRGGVTLHALSGKSATAVRNGKLFLSAGYPSTFEYLLYNVVGEQSGGGVSPAYTAVFGSTGWICRHQSILATYGFAKLGTACGTQT